MIFQSTLIASLFASAAVAETVLTSNSKAGSKVLSNARKLNGQYEENYAWMTDYSLKFEGCHSIHTYGGEAQAEEAQSLFGVQHLAKFKLCSTSKGCSSCTNGGEYMVELGQFAEAWLQADQEIKQNKCQKVEENCNCEYYYGDDQACLAKCYATAGLDYCQQEENNFNAAEYMECREANFGNNNYYGTKYYIGPLCANGGKHVKLSVFTDARCTVEAPSGTYEKYNYGYALPYSSQSMINASGCLSCKEEVEQEQNQYYGYQQNYEQAEPLDVCTELYEQSAKCETKMSAKNKYTRDTGSCDYINKVVPALEKVYVQKGGSGGAATGFAIFFSITTVAAAAAAYYYYTKVERSNVDLSGNGGDFA